MKQLTPQQILDDLTEKTREALKEIEGRRIENIESEELAGASEKIAKSLKILNDKKQPD